MFDVGIKSRPLCDPAIRVVNFVAGFLLTLITPGLWAAEESTGTRVMPVKVAPAVQPGQWFTIGYRFEADGPLAKENKVFVHFLDVNGKTVSDPDHYPGTPTYTKDWKGPVAYDRPIKLPANLPEGTYQIAIGLHDDKDRTRLTLEPGPGVKDIGENRYQAGTVTVDKNASREKLSSEGPKTLDLTGYKLTFSEEFDGPLDVSAWGPRTRWIAHTPWNGDFGDAQFADPTDTFPFTVKDGILRIEARKDDAFALTDQYGRKWRAGLLSSNDAEGKGFSQQYGYFEMRAKLPSGPGLWPAFWLCSSFDRTDKQAGKDGAVEIDVIEFYGREPSAFNSVVHVWEPKPHRGTGTIITTKPNEVNDGFHNYGVMVRPDFITMYFDGIEVWKFPTPPEHNKPLFLLLNLALGSGQSVEHTPNPSVMEVDHVRAYQAPPGE